MLGRSNPVATSSGSRRPSRWTTSVRHPRRCGGRGRHERPRAQHPGGVGEAEVVGAEVVPPLRDAVRLVHHEQAHPHPGHRLEEPGRREALRRHVQQAQLAGGRAPQRRGVRRAVALGVDERDPVAEPAGGQRLHLVLHQRHQRRDHHREVVAQQGGKLVAERLARARGHHHQHVPVRQRGLAGLSLPRAEAGEAEAVVQGCGEPVHEREGHPSAGPGRTGRAVTQLLQKPRYEGRPRLREARRPPASFERELPVRRAGSGERVVAREAGVAVRLARGADRLVDPAERQVRERVAPELLRDLLLGPAVGDHLLRRRHVDAVVAGVPDRGSRDPHVDLGRAHAAQHLDDLPGGVAAHDRVVHHHEPLPLDHLAERVELHAQAVLAELLAGLDEGPGHVAVLDQPVVARDARRLRVAGRRGVARVGHGDHHVGVHGRLAPEDLSHLATRHLCAVALEDRVGAREVDVLEHAEGLALGLDQLARLDPALAQRHHLARLHLAQQLRADDVERAALRGEAVGVAEPAEGERPQAGGIAEADHRVLRHHDRREGALEARHHLGQRVLHALGGVGRQERRDDLRVGRAAEMDALVAQLAVELDRVDEVAVVGERDLAEVGAPDRLRVLPGRGPGCRVAHVPEGHLALERAQLLLVEHLRDEAEVADGHDVAGVGGRDPGRLLAAVLQREQREVREPGDVRLGRVHAEDAALVARSVAMVELVSHSVGGRCARGGATGGERSRPLSVPVGVADASGRHQANAAGMAPS